MSGKSTPPEKDAPPDEAAQPDELAAPAVVVVHTPVRGYSGTGPGGVVFEDGRAEVPAGSSALAYFRDQGYGVGSPAAAVRPLEAPDSREFPEHLHLGSPLRDAAVDPEAGDYLPPIGAGVADPHGRRVAAPGVHAEGPGPIPGGPVPDDPADQAEAVTDAAAVLLPAQSTPARKHRRNG